MPSSKPCPSFFLNSSTEESHQLAKQLIRYVEEANYKEARKIASNHPKVLFQTVGFYELDGTQKKLSPLQYAFRLYDATMWKIFHDIVKDKSHLMLEFVAQTLDFDDFLDLTPLFDAYTQYNKKYKETCSEDNLMEVEERILYLEEVCINVSNAMRLYLPRHMLFEMTQAHRSNFYEGIFSEADPTNPPSLGRCYYEELNYFNHSLDFIFSGHVPNRYTNKALVMPPNSLEDVIAFMQNTYFYDHGIIARGDNGVGATMVKWAGFIGQDKKGFMALMEKRKGEFMLMQTEFKQLLDLALLKVSKITTILWLLAEKKDFVIFPKDIIYQVALSEFDSQSWQSVIASRLVTEKLEILNNPERSKPAFLKSLKLHSEKLSTEKVAHAIWLKNSTDEKAKRALKEFSVWSIRHNIPVSEEEVLKHVQNNYTFS